MTRISHRNTQTSNNNRKEEGLRVSTLQHPTPQSNLRIQTVQNTTTSQSRTTINQSILKFLTQHHFSSCFSCSRVCEIKLSKTNQSPLTKSSVVDGETFRMTIPLEAAQKSERQLYITSSVFFAFIIDKYFPALHQNS